MTRLLLLLCCHGHVIFKVRVKRVDECDITTMLAVSGSNPWTHVADGMRKASQDLRRGVCVCVRVCACVRVCGTANVQRLKVYSRGKLPHVARHTLIFFSKRAISMQSAPHN